MDASSIKLVTVGDFGCGKSCLLYVYGSNEFPLGASPTVSDSMTKSISVDGKLANLTVLDTAAQEEYDRLRPLQYPGTNVIVMCFAVDSPESFKNIRAKWVPEIKHFCRNVPIILVGNKEDLRHDMARLEELNKMNQALITPEEGQAMAKKIKAFAYLECSAKRNNGVQDVFETAVRAAFHARETKNTNCILF